MINRMYFMSAQSGGHILSAAVTIKSLLPDADRAYKVLYEHLTKKFRLDTGKNDDLCTVCFTRLQ